MLLPASIGHVSVKRAGSSTFGPASNGESLHVGDTIQTDSVGLAEIDYATDTYTRLDVSTTFTITKLTDSKGDRQVNGTLQTGQTWNRTVALTQSQSFDQEGAGTTAAVAGTAFVVDCTTPTTCTFTAVIDNVDLTGNAGQTQILNPLTQCVSTDGTLCTAPSMLNPDEVALLQWITTNVTLDLTDHGLGNGVFAPFGGTVQVEAGSAQSFTPSTPNQPFTPATAPGAPTIVSVTAGNRDAAVSWLPPASDGGSPIIGYTVTASDPAQCVAPAPATSCTVDGLANGTPYTFSVTATNAIGTGPSSPPSGSVTPATVPDAPTGVGAAVGDASAVVSFTPPVDDGGSSITGYTATCSGPSVATESVSGSGSPITVASLVNGTAYSCSVVATNHQGNSLPSGAATVTPATTPGAPTGVTAFPGYGEAEVAFSPPASDGGSTILSYSVAGGGSGCSTSGTSCVVTGLTNTDSYTFTVTATNGVGAGPSSDPSNSVTPPIVVPFGSTWLESGTAPPDSTWETGNTSGFTSEPAPFGNGADGPGGYEQCGFPAANSPFPTDATLYLETSFQLPTDATGLALLGTIDNNATIYLNGAFLSQVDSGFCVPNAIDVDLTGATPGTNTLAVVVQDTGGGTFFDASVQYTVDGTLNVGASLAATAGVEAPAAPTNPTPTTSTTSTSTTSTTSTTTTTTTTSPAATSSSTGGSTSG